MKLESDYLYIRKIENSDIEQVFEGLSHPEVIRHYGVSFRSLEETKTQMEWFAKDEQEWFAICSKDNDEFLGACGFNDISKNHRKAEIGLWLQPEHWGKGIMKKAMNLICDYGFDELGLHRIEGFVEAGNTNCKRAMDKLAFEHEGTMHDCEIKNGQYLSVDIYAFIKKKK